MTPNIKPVAATPPPSLSVAERAVLEFCDADNAARILAAFGSDLVFVSGRGWAVWDGSRYSHTSGALAARDVGHRLRDLVQEEAEWARRAWPASDQAVEAFRDTCSRRKPPALFVSTETARNAMRAEAAHRLAQHATKCGNVAKVKAALEVCEHQRRAEVSDMDADPWALVCPNGQVNLRAAVEWRRSDGAVEREEIATKRAWLVPVDRTALPSRCAGVAFDPAADCPRWHDFLELIMPDAEVRACLKRCLGATLLGENRAQICLILRGPGGNGKSILLNTLSHVLGGKAGYAAPCKMEMFLESSMMSPSSATPEEAGLPGARAYIATEPGARDVLSGKAVKAFTGGDQRLTRGLYSDSFAWTPHGIPILSCNRTPKIKDDDEGIRRRLVFLPFEVNLRALPREQQRPQADVETELRAEGSGILNWLLEGCAEFVERGVDMPDRMTKLKTQLLESADPVGIFLTEMTVPLERARLSVTDFYRVHERWCEIEGRQLFQMKTVGDVMVEKGYERGLVTGRSHWKGITWSDAARDLCQEVLGYAARTPAEPPAF